MKEGCEGEGSGAGERGEKENEQANLLLQYLDGRIAFDQWSTMSGIEEEGAGAREREEDDDDERGGESRNESLWDVLNDTSTEIESGSVVSSRVSAGKREHKDISSASASAEADEFIQDLTRDRLQRKRRFMDHLKVSRGPAVRRSLSSHQKSMMGRANICFAKREMEEATKLCIELIRQAPFCVEPFQTLAMIYEETEERDKCFEISLITAHLQRNDVDLWVKLAEMSMERHDVKRAISCISQAISLTSKDKNSTLLCADLLWKRAGFYQSLSQLPKALSDYEKIEEVLPAAEEGPKHFQVAIEIAKLHNESTRSDKAVSVLQAAFEKYPDCIDLDGVNLLAELAIAAQNYELAHDVICSHCNVSRVGAGAEPLPSSTGGDLHELSSVALQQERIGDTLLSAAPESATSDIQLAHFLGDSAEIVVPPVPEFVYAVPDDLHIDIRAKLIVCLVHKQQIEAAKNATEVLLRQDPTTFGDLFLDVAEVFSLCGRYEIALSLQSQLVQTEKYNQAGVWLRVAECHSALGQLEEAIVAYERVIALAPTHLDARLSLSSLYQQLDRPEKALLALTQTDDVANFGEYEIDDDWMEGGQLDLSFVHDIPIPLDREDEQTKDYQIMLHKCRLLKDQNQLNEFAACGLEMLSYYFRHVYYAKNLRGICLYSCRKARQEMRKGATGSDPLPRRLCDYAKEANIDAEDWWKLFIEVGNALIELGRLGELRRLAFACAASHRFAPPTSKGIAENVRVACAIACLACKEYHVGFEYIRVLCQKHCDNVPLWNLANTLMNGLRDRRLAKFAMRLLIIKNSSNSLPLLLTVGHNCLYAGSHKLGLATYQRALVQDPNNSLIVLCVAVCYLNLAMKRFNSFRHAHVVQAFALFRRYMNLRGVNSETYYNVARAFHQLDLNYLAVVYYNKVLNLAADSTTSLHREAAFNLSLIYRQSNQPSLARTVLFRYCSI